MESLTSTPQPTLSHELRALINQRNILTATSKAKVLNELDKQIEENKTKRQMYLRNRVVEEIFTSESSYLHQLEIIMKYFKEPLDSSDLLSPVAKKILFGNVESIYRVNGELVNELKTEGNNIAAAFMHLAPFFKLYSMYIYEYKNILSLLEEVSKSNPKLSMWIKNQESRPEVANSLSALLIVPVQRLPRYRLLLSRLLSLTPASHPHHSTLVEAVKEVEKATAHVDNLVVEQEVQERLLTLQQCLVGSKPSIVAPNKKLLKEGVLMTIGSHSKSQKGQRNYVILLSDSLLFCKFTSRERARFGPPVKPGSLRCCCILPIGKCSVQTVLSQGMFTLSCCNKSFTIYSDVKEEVICWVEDIEGAISQYQDNEKTLRTKRSGSRHSLLLNRKRKCLKENESTKEIPSPAKRVKVCDPNVQREKTNFLRPIKALFQTFGESVRRYLYPGPASS
ncbi:FYVE, RhoGEF and PH domain-containing protein 6-like isoform X2 [Homalodisca vitripennis]|uniref:FYVE, RhoGEF and PH domain-containing protein 6-like isoform X2 n=1 Tax=Homalodisca vitripennis TaxID=197043 RepID=UPI001EE9FBA6|nr:FYVE, RhoGEF and PH domain-containing protein 6-like isoform X2 [Homalodisca vitripennis]